MVDENLVGPRAQFDREMESKSREELLDVLFFSRQELLIAQSKLDTSLTFLKQSATLTNDYSEKLQALSDDLWVMKENPSCPGSFEYPIEKTRICEICGETAVIHFPDLTDEEWGLYPEIIDLVQGEDESETEECEGLFHPPTSGDTLCDSCGKTYREHFPIITCNSCDRVKTSSDLEDGDVPRWISGEDGFEMCGQCQLEKAAKQ